MVELARRRLSTRKVGHTGTLDPLATGVLILASEASTKLVPYLVGERKTYLAWVSFGATTETLDAEGPIVHRLEASFDQSALETALSGFLNVTEQVPPAYSAVKVGGVRAYRAARSGKVLQLEPRSVQYNKLELLSFGSSFRNAAIAAVSGGWTVVTRAGRRVNLPEPLDNFLTAVIRLEVGSGTYVRAFARDLANRLGTVGFISGLVRVQVGRVDLGSTVIPDTLDAEHALNEAEILGFPVLELSATEIRYVQQGVPLPVPAQGMVSLVDGRRRLVAVAEGDGFKLRIKRVLLPT